MAGGNQGQSPSNAREYDCLYDSSRRALRVRFARYNVLASTASRNRLDREGRETCESAALDTFVTMF